MITELIFLGKLSLVVLKITLSWALTILCLQSEFRDDLSRSDWGLKKQQEWRLL